MSWPVQIIPPDDKVPEIKWRKWFFSFLCILLFIVVSWGVAKVIAPTEESKFLRLFTLLFFLWLFAYSIILSVRIYYYGVCLSVFEARELEVASVRKDWTAWASQKFHVSTYNLFLPDLISKTDIASSNFVEIYKEQQLKLRGHNGEAYTEEQLIYELLSSVRSKLIILKKSCVFDVIFTYGSSYATFSTFKECWAAIGFAGDCLGNYYDWDDTLEQKFDTLSNIESNRVAIIISANIEGVEKYCSDSTEFASILLVTHQSKLTENENNRMVLRTMACSKGLTKKEFIHMMNYQPNVLGSSIVLFSNMSADDALDVSNVLKTSSLSMNIEWEYEAQHLNLMLGNLGDPHFWLVLALALFISEKNNESVLMVASVGEDYVFNVINTSDDRGEH
ncbi:hypothetical protein [Citrobacter sp. U14242]|uniref:hypothetical protein n=1 Tax=Citrobacter sp. U14242 TaxID=3390192 RepID=UPI00397B690E